MDKNIIFVTNLHLWSLEKGKGGRAFITTVESYLSESWNIWFVSTGGNIPDDIRQNITCYEFYNSKLKKLLQSRLKIVRFVGRYLNVWINDLFYIRSIKDIMVKNPNKRFVIYAYEVGGVRIGRKMSTKYGMPLVTRFQGTILADIPNTFVNRIRNHPHFSALKTTADVIIMTNDGTRGLQTLKRLGNNSQKIYFWRNGVTIAGDEELNKRDSYRFQFGWGKEFVLFMVSRLVPWKKVERAIYALQEVVKDCSDIKLVIAGDGVTKTMLENLVKDLGLTKYVIFTGSISQTCVYEYMIAADAFLSLYDLSNVGNPLLEAMSCGLPIITLNNGDTGEVITNGKNGILIDPSRLDLIPASIKRVYSDKHLCTLLGEEARNYALENFWSWRDRLSMETEIVGNLLR